jgi:Carboxypeptidase regulatory-like domain
MSEPVSTGNLSGTVVDQQGDALPAATVTLKGEGAPQIKVTNAQGQFSYLELQPGSYTAEAELDGFRPAEQPVIINAGENTNIEITLSPSE